MSEELADQLRKSFLFHGLPEAALVRVAQRVATRKLAEGDVLMRRGERGDALYMVADGWFKIVTEGPQGEEVIINKTGPGQTIGEMALLDQAPRSATAIALGPAVVLELKHDDFRMILDRSPDVAFMLIRELSSRLRFSTTYIQTAIEWSQKIAEGDYSFVEQGTQGGQGASDQDKAEQLLSAFFKMVTSVKAREDDLKQQLERLTLEIDDSRRKTEFEELTSTDFYARLKEQASKLRAQRKAGEE